MSNRNLAEMLGTFVIVLAPVLAATFAKWQGTDPGLLVMALVSGLPVLAMISALGGISGAHFNPAVTIGLALAGRFPWRYVPVYVFCQFSGGVCASAVAYLIFGVRAGAHVPVAPASIVQSIAIEAVITFVLMVVIMGVATDKRVTAPVPTFAIGATVVMGVLIGGPITGGSMNPARSIGPALLDTTATSSVWIYILGPFIGAALGAFAFEAVRTDDGSAQSVPPDLAP